MALPVSPSGFSVVALAVTSNVVSAVAASEISPSAASSPFTSTKALLEAFTTATAVTGIAVVAPGSLLPTVLACILMLRVESACNRASPPALTLPALSSVTAAELTLCAQSTAHVMPRSFRNSGTTSDKPDIPGHSLLLKVV